MSVERQTALGTIKSWSKPPSCKAIVSCPQPPQRKPRNSKSQRRNMSGKQTLSVFTKLWNCSCSWIKNFPSRNSPQYTMNSVFKFNHVGHITLKVCRVFICCIFMLWSSCHCGPQLSRLSRHVIIISFLCGGNNGELVLASLMVITHCSCLYSLHCVLHLLMLLFSH